MRVSFVDGVNQMSKFVDWKLRDFLNGDLTHENGAGVFRVFVCKLSTISVSVCVCVCVCVYVCVIYLISCYKLSPLVNLQQFFQVLKKKIRTQNYLFIFIYFLSPPFPCSLVFISCLVVFSPPRLPLPPRKHTQVFTLNIRHSIFHPLASIFT